jgi:hypothetical protein
VRLGSSANEQLYANAENTGALSVSVDTELVGLSKISDLVDASSFDVKSVTSSEQHEQAADCSVLAGAAERFESAYQSAFYGLVLAWHAGYLNRIAGCLAAAPEATFIETGTFHAPEKENEYTVNEENVH